ncbi:MAG: winged helix-turn-helix domain-containing protein [Anaerolineae bacterium]|nr:winged helix-turn-helix domain-containing protein [Anaerolineae bacterium]
MSKRSAPRLPLRWIRRILGVLYERRYATRKQIARSTRLNPASVSQAVRQLVERGVIQSNQRLASSGGR